MSPTKTKIRSIVSQLLEKYQIENAPVPVKEIILGEGLNVVNREVEDEVSGFLIFENEQPTIGVNKRHSPNRRRYTLAHELGHFMLDHVSANDPLRIDRVSQVMFRDESSSKGKKREEIEANQFAAELLMPTSLLLSDWDDLDESDVEDAIDDLAKKYKVSTQAMTFRLVNLNKLNF